MGKSKKRKASANASLDASETNDNVSSASESEHDGQNKSILSNVLAAASSVLYGSPTRDGSKNATPATPLTSTPKWPQTGSTASTDPTNSQSFDMIMGTVVETNRKLDFVLGKLEKLDNIQSVLGNLVSTVNDLESRVKVLESSSNEFKDSVSFVSNKVDEFERLSKSTPTKVGQELARQEKMLESLCKGVEDLRRSRNGIEDKLTDLKWRSMKNNLVFTGLGNESRDEDTEDKLRHFIQMELGIDQHIELSNVHRFGKPRRDGKRPIVAKFLYNKERELVKNRGFMLRDTSYGIQEQLPPDMNQRRKQLLPIMHRLRNEGNRAKLVRDKLFVNGKLYVPDEVEDITEADMSLSAPTAGGDA
jgi:hypothetical protein